MSDTKIKPVKYFLDCEFIEDGKTIDLLSIALVCEDGREYYAQNAEAKFEHASDWVWRNVFPHLKHFDMRGHCGKEGGECSGCAKIICPFEEELHFHHDGCPACCNAPKDNPALLKRQKIDNIITTIDSVLPRKV